MSLRVMSSRLLSRYERTWADRGLPWREEHCSPDLRVLVEGMLIRTRAEAVASHWDRIFGGIESADDWLDLLYEEQLCRASVTGLGALKLRVTQALAYAVSGVDPVGALKAAATVGTTSYCCQVALLLYGQLAWPVDANVERVADRMHVVPIDLVDAVVGSVYVTGEAVDHGTWPPPRPYRAFMGLIDVAHRFCGGSGLRNCKGCPLRRACLELRHHWAVAHGYNRQRRGPASRGGVG